MKKSRTFASAIEKQTRIRNAQMAESVDALVSNTSGFTSIPVRPRVWVHKGESFKAFSFFISISRKADKFIFDEGILIFPLLWSDLIIGVVSSSHWSGWI